MLSITNSVNDVKIRLAQTYEHYGLASSFAFNKAIELALEDTQYLYIYPVIGSSFYAVTKAKNKINLSEKETYLYLSEINYACCVFLKKRDADKSSSSTTKTAERLHVEGYEYESESGTSSGDSSVDMASAIKDFYNTAVHYMCIAGYNPHNIQRGGGMFGQQPSEVILGEIV